MKKRHAEKRKSRYICPAMTQLQTNPSARLLVVDDDPASLHLMDTLFTEEGMRVVAAKSVAEARSLLEAHNWDFDLVVSDISMPKETGFDLLRWIKEEERANPDLQVILVTAARPESENRILGLTLGAVDYIVRPIDLKELVLRVVQALGNARRVNNLRESLESSQHMALAGRMLAASTHEIKNLAGIIQLATDTLSKQMAKNIPQDTVTHKALDVLKRATGMLCKVAKESGKLLDRSADNVTKVALAAIIEDVETMIRNRLKMVHIEVEPIDDSCHWAIGHELYIKQILINFLLNAGEAIAELEPEGGGNIKVSIQPQGQGRVGILVTDNGIGLPEPSDSRVFSAFQTTKSLKGGQGLGLWYCDQLAKYMRGYIGLKSQGPGQGACSYLVLEKPN